MKAPVIPNFDDTEKEKFKAKMERPFIVILLFLCFLAIGCLDIPPLVRSIRAQSWPTVQGTVIHYDVKHVILGKEPAWDPIIEYTYNVANVQYKGTELRFQRYRALGGYDAFQMKDKYTDNSPVIVHYNPSNPYSSVIQTAPTLWRVVFNLVCCLMWAALAYFSTYPRVGPEAPTPAHLSASEEEASSSGREQTVAAP